MNSNFVYMLSEQINSISDTFEDAFKNSLFTSRPDKNIKSIDIDNGILVRIELPGCTSNDVKVIKSFSTQYKTAILKVVAEYVDEQFGDFKFEHTIVPAYKIEKVDSVLKNGVLLLTILKTSENLQEDELIPTK